MDGGVAKEEGQSYGALIRARNSTIIVRNSSVCSIRATTTLQA